MQKHLIIFIKNPKLGSVKTRLAKDVGDEVALEIYLDLMEKCREESQLVDAKRHLYYSEDIDNTDSWDQVFFEKKVQAGGDLGMKIRDAFQTVSYEGGPILIIGSDCYDLTAEIMEEAFTLLKEVDLVLGPANDGGYYLLGSNQFHPSLFEQINWSTSSVLQETIEQANKAELSIAILEELVDLDTLEDLEKSSYHYKNERND